ncbi:ABC transporter permease subunit [candidate division KSB3 bacterium]|uniref:ABC transporter permease subunit n=1 Tax=candidate division KSB3 bacterium TaxID=2044937 RepID=A0A9D5JZ78_9BACT|nr:ABC transporter permease subunit [candidate division KSB3 bacterium]MBD3326512.1 ABC transporter permease subunit [candidate division KSB3 bacterium]
MSDTRTGQEIQRAIQRKKILRTGVMTIIIFAIAILYFSPVLYMFLSAFKTEHQAVSPSLVFDPTLETFQKVLSNENMYGFLKNSVFQVFFGTIFCLILGTPAAFALIFGKFKHEGTNGKIYLWFLTTIVLPPVAVIIPLYTWFQTFNLIDNRFGLLIIYVGFHVPIVVWMLRSFFSDVPVEILEAADIDGCSRLQQLVFIAIPLVRTGIIAAGLLVAVFIWNEFFLAFNLTGNTAATLPVYMARFREQQGMFVAQLSAASTIVILPAVIFGWISQKSLVKGLTAGGVKG